VGGTGDGAADGRGSLGGADPLGDATRRVAPRPALGEDEGGDAPVAGEQRVLDHQQRHPLQPLQAQGVELVVGGDQGQKVGLGQKAVEGVGARRSARATCKGRWPAARRRPMRHQSGPRRGSREEEAADPIIGAAYRNKSRGTSGSRSG
jgi:hypothetical protein